MFMAPEILDKGYYNKSTDIYSLGVTIFHLITFEYPF